MTRSPDVVVVGGGAIGLASAWRLAQRGLAVELFDPEPGAGASGVAAGMLAPVTEARLGEEALLQLGLASWVRWPGFAAELEAASGESIGYRPDGTVVVALDGDDRAAMADLLDRQRSLGLEVTDLSAREVRSLEPALAPAVRRGALAAGERSVDPAALVQALLVAVERAGVVIRHERVVALSRSSAGDRAGSAGRPVRSGGGVGTDRPESLGRAAPSGGGVGPHRPEAGSEPLDSSAPSGSAVRPDRPEAGALYERGDADPGPDGDWAETSSATGAAVPISEAMDRISGVVLESGRAVAAGTVVLAAGAWTAQVVDDGAGAWPLPVRPVKGQILTLRQRPDDLVVRHTVRGFVRGSSIYLVPRDDGRVVCGATVEERGWDAVPTAGAAYELLRDVLALFPGLDEAELVGVRTGFRPGTTDDLPLIGVGSRPGLILATGHYRNGILLAPVTADAVAALVTGTPPPAEIEPCRPSRFAEQTPGRTGFVTGSPATEQTPGRTGFVTGSPATEQTPGRTGFVTGSPATEQTPGRTGFVTGSPATEQTPGRTGFVTGSPATEQTPGRTGFVTGSPATEQTPGRTGFVTGSPATEQTPGRTGFVTGSPETEQTRSAQEMARP